LRRGSLALLLLAGLAVAACSSGSDSPDATATPEPAQTREGSNGAQAMPLPAGIISRGEQILADVRYLSEKVGPRPAGTPREKEAADFIAERLRSFGYEVRLQQFSIGREYARGSALAVTGGEERTIPSVPFERSGSGTVKAPLVAAGRGAPGDFTAAARDAVVLIERGGQQFSEKVANAQAAGARGAIIYNNEAGIYYGTLQNESRIPAVSISQAEGQALLRNLGAGAVDAELTVGSLGDGVSYNVVASPPDRACETVSGGHYDSVPQAPGASDNATGTATIMNIAEELSRSGHMGSHCFVLFGAEELGLLGSRAYVDSLDNGARQRLKAMLNFDMVGVGDEGWGLIGTASLQQRAISVASNLGIRTERADLPMTTSSDHVNFIAAGIPALMVHRFNDPLLHTPEDVADRVKPELLDQAARLGVALLESLAAGG
jgi:aminopeptidase YwaD